LKTGRVMRVRLRRASANIRSSLDRAVLLIEQAESTLGALRHSGRARQ
jgi:hypothetical protein